MSIRTGRTSGKANAEAGTQEPWRILAQDTSLVAVHKPEGLPVIPGHQLRLEETLHGQLEHALGRKVWVVHRLDRDTSGVLLFALSAEAHRTLSLQFERQQVKKVYLAWVQGRMTSALREEGLIDAPLREFGSGRVAVHPEGKPSQTAFTVLRLEATRTLLELRPQSGRRHQLRAHLYSLGHPIEGDPLYGKERAAQRGRLMLHALRIEFIHPGGGIRVIEDPVDWLEDKVTAEGS